jgi:hypothetical protein
MAQITLYLEDETARKLKSVAESSGKSVSSLVAGLIRRKISDHWPENITRLAGAWSDIPDAEQIRSGQPKDLPRETL